MSVEIPKTVGCVTINYCVARAKLELDDFTSKSTEKLTQFAINEITNLNLFLSKNLEVAYIDMDSNGIVTLPNDFVDYIKIGIPKNGRLYILSLNKNTLLRRDGLSSEAANQIFNGNTSGTESDIYYFIDHYRNGQFIGGLYGVGGGFASSSYRIDMEKYPRQIQFDTSVPRSEIVIEYISTGIRLSGTTVIPRHAVNFIVDSIKETFVLSDHKLRKDRFYVQKLENRKIESENMFKHVEYKFNPQEYLDAMRQVTKLSTQR